MSNQDKKLEDLYQKAMAAARTPAGRAYARKISRISGLAEHEVIASVKSFDKDAGPPNIPNLDEMGEDALMSFWNKYRFRSKKNLNELFPGWNQRQGLAKVMFDLANYASNKTTEKACRRRGDDQAAGIYASHCKLIYDKLPEFARFRR